MERLQDKPREKMKLKDDQRYRACTAFWLNQHDEHEIQERLPACINDSYTGGWWTWQGWSEPAVFLHTVAPWESPVPEARAHGRAALWDGWALQIHTWAISVENLQAFFRVCFLGRFFLKHVLVALGCLILHSFLIALLCLAKLVAGNNENWINMSTPSIATYTFI